MKKDFLARIISFSEAYEMAYRVSTQITESSERIDIIIGISRGGLPPARMICDFLNINTLTSIQIRHYTSGGKEKEKVEIIDPVNLDLKEKNILIVDDVNDSGKTLKAAYEHIITFEPESVKTAVLHEKADTIFDAHYLGEKQSEWKWLIYQWAVTEDLLEFLDKNNMIQTDEDEAIKWLAEKYDLTVDKDLYRKILSMRKNYL